MPTAIESARLHGQLTRSDEHTATEDVRTTCTCQVTKVLRNPEGSICSISSTVRMLLKGPLCVAIMYIVT